jgi:hypothetical protein
MKIKLKHMKFRSYLILFSVLVCSSNLNAQNNLNRITGLSSTTASVAYSLRQLSTSYTGPLVRIKVGTLFYDVYPDATTYNFTLSSKISASISTYNAAVSAASANALSTIITAGTTNATVAIWYDQSGNLVHVLSNTSNAKIITSGTINSLNGQPTIYFSDISSYLTSSVTVDYTAQTVATLNAAVQNVASTNYISGIISTGDNGGWGLCYDPTSTIKGYWVDASGGNGAFSNENTSDAKIVTGSVGKTISSYIYINSVLKNTKGAQGLSFTTTDKIYVGSRGNFSDRQFIGNISEVFMFAKTLSNAEQTALETSQSIFLPPSVTITSSASGAVCAGTNITFTAVASNISTPTYQWYKNGVAISGATSSTYSSTSLSNNDVINISCGNASTIVSDNTLSLWLDAGSASNVSGTTWTDLSGKGNHATFNSHQTYSSTSGGYFQFDGTANPVLINKVTSAITEVTMSAWVYITPGTTQGSFIKNGAGLGYTFGAGGGGGFCAGTYPGMLLAGQGWLGSNSPTSNFSTGWQLCTMVITGSSPTTYRYYINGTLANTATFSSPSAPNGSYTALGDNYGDGGGCTPFNSKMGAAYIYTKALSVSEITQNYNASAARFGLSSTSSVSSNTITSTVNASPTTPIITTNGDACVNKTSLTTPTGLTSYAWYKDNVSISGATSSTYTPTASGVYQVTVSNGTCTNTSAATTIYSCGKTAEGKMSPITSSTTLVTIAGEINSKYGVDERGLMLTKPFANIPTGTNPVTTGLILYLDATRPASYSGTGNTWADISGLSPAGSATLVGSPVFGSGSTTNGSGSFTFGSNINASTTKTYTIDNEITYIAWVNPSTNFDGGVIVRRTDPSFNSGATSLYLYNNNLGYDWDNQNWGWRSNLTVPNNQWSMIVITVNSSTVTAYMCNASGIASASSGRGHSSLTSKGATNFYIAYDPYSPTGRALNGKMGTAMVYSVALSSADISSIFNAQKASFGL